jgi:hypothetical protein
MMVELVEIKDTKLTPVAPDERLAETQPRVSWFDLMITLRNASDAGPLYIVSEVCGLRYDAGRRALIVQFSERDAPDRRLSIDLPPPPKYSTVAPDDETAIKYRLASPITFTEVSSDGARTSNSVHIPSDVDVIECAIAYGSTPPPRENNLAALDPLPDRRGWGTTVSCKVPVAKDASRAGYDRG